MHKAHEVLGLVPSTVTHKTKDVPKNCLVTQLTYNHRPRKELSMAEQGI